MRVRIRVTTDEAKNLCRFLKAYCEFIKNASWIRYETILDDSYRLERKLRLTNVNTLKGNKKISFTLDGLTIMDLYEGFFMPKDDRIKQCLMQCFDEPNTYMIMWAAEQVMKCVNTR